MASVAGLTASSFLLSSSLFLFSFSRSDPISSPRCSQSIASPPHVHRPYLIYPLELPPTVSCLCFPPHISQPYLVFRWRKMKLTFKVCCTQLPPLLLPHHAHSHHSPEYLAYTYSSFPGFETAEICNRCRVIGDGKLTPSRPSRFLQCGAERHDRLGK